jgi:hypothetical protein
MSFSKFIIFYHLALYSTVFRLFCQYFMLYFVKILGGISHNVPAVYDGLTARIEKSVAFLGLANCGCSEPWEGA